MDHTGGKRNGGTKRGGKDSKCRKGGAFGAVAGKAIVPFGLVALNGYFGKSHRHKNKSKKSKTRRRRRRS